MSNPAFQKILAGIAAATDAHVLLNIDRARIPKCADLTDLERELAHRAVRARFCALNEAAGYDGKKLGSSIISQRIAA